MQTLVKQAELNNVLLQGTISISFIISNSLQTILFSDKLEAALNDMLLITLLLIYEHAVPSFYPRIQKYCIVHSISFSLSYHRNLGNRK